ncbi:MAG: cation-translocating P-type ATPase, partial [Planctomycetaceae bacterium]|nr:cation-translocating P-type ATPase [Planctomycetaceae bacterium]
MSIAFAASPLTTQAGRTETSTSTSRLFGGDFLARTELLIAFAAASVFVVGVAWEQWISDNLEVGSLLQFVAALIVVVPTLGRALKGMIDGGIDSYSDQLLSLALLAAVFGGEWTTAVVVPLVMAIGHAAERRSIQGTNDAIDGLRRLQARRAILAAPEGEREVPAEALVAGDLVLLKPGTTVPADGVVLRGVSSLDEAPLTGESHPRDVAVGDNVFAGTSNLSGLLTVRVTKTGDETSLGKVAELLANAAHTKAPVVRMIERCAELYVPAVILIAAYAYFVTQDQQRVIALFIAACPCALVLAGPVTMVAALAAASRLGLLVKHSRHFETLADVDMLICDKTGTVTRGVLEVEELVPAAEVSPDELLEAATRCATCSNHPIAKAVHRFARARNMNRDSDIATEEAVEVPGCGIELRESGRVLRMGRAHWLLSGCASSSTVPDHCGPLTTVTENERFLGYILLSDQVRSEAAAAVRELRQLGIRRTLLLTGDREATARLVGVQVGFDEVVADALPTTKLSVVEKECAAGYRLIVVGDGINDAPALARAHVSVAVAERGTDIALQSADISLVSPDLRRIPA